MQPNQAGITNVIRICTNSDCSQTKPVTSMKQLEIAEGALGDFFGPGTTVGIPFAAQVGIRVLVLDPVADTLRGGRRSHEIEGSHGLPHRVPLAPSSAGTVLPGCSSGWRRNSIASGWVR